MSRRGLIAATAMLTILAGQTAARAAIPDANGLITSCYSTDPAGPFGALRVIDVGQSMSCTAGEQQLTFEQKGPAGPAGPQGPPGPAGPGTEYVRYPWHYSFTELGHGNYSVDKLATTTMVVPSAGTWVVRAEIWTNPGSNVRFCSLGLVDGITLPTDINPHFGNYLTYEQWMPPFFFGNGFSPVPELDVHAVLTKPSYAVLRCEPTGGPNGYGSLTGGEVLTDIEAWKVAGADDSNGSALTSQPQPTQLPNAIAPALQSALSKKTTSKLLALSGGAKLTRRLRARILLLEGQGLPVGQISALVGATSAQITRTIHDFNRSGLKSLR